MAVVPVPNRARSTRPSIQGDHQHICMPPAFLAEPPRSLTSLAGLLFLVLGGGQFGVPRQLEVRRLETGMPLKNIEFREKYIQLIPVVAGSGHASEGPSQDLPTGFYRAC